MLVVITLFFIIVLRQEKSKDTLAILVTSARLQMELVIFTETFQGLPEVQASHLITPKVIRPFVVKLSCSSALINEHLSCHMHLFMRRIMGTWSVSTLTS